MSIQIDVVTELMQRKRKSMKIAWTNSEPGYHSEKMEPKQGKRVGLECRKTDV